jgi:hypothetical protein
VFLRAFLILSFCFTAFGRSAPPSGLSAHYAVSSGMTELAAPFTDVDVVYGPSIKNARWMQFVVRSHTNVLCAVRYLTSTNPTRISRYQLLIGTEATEYLDVNSGLALLPTWADFEHNFLPQPAQGTALLNGVPRTCKLLGHMLSLHGTTQQEWQSWTNVHVLNLNREILVGTGRNFKDAEGHRLPQKPDKHEYTYVEFKADDYNTMIDAGINLFWIAPHQEQYVRDRPVFYIRAPDGKPALNYPADLYRANFLGATMFMDEPAVLTIYDANVQKQCRSVADLCALIEMRTHATYTGAQAYGERHFESMLKNMGVNFGDMQLLHPDFPVWETRHEFGFYEMRAGGAGIVQEGRYNVKPFNDELQRSTGTNWNFSADDMLRINFALLRGGVAPFNKFWGMAIYGQCDPVLAPSALTTAYDMGARYFWFWTSDHDHHLPYNEQLALARTVKEHAAKHPRSSIYERPQKRDVAIAIPEGFCFPFDSLRWVEGPTPQMKEAQSARLQHIRLQTLEAIKKCLAHHQDFDITVDDGRRIDGYRHVVRVQ